MCAVAHSSNCIQSSSGSEALGTITRHSKICIQPHDSCRLAQPGIFDTFWYGTHTRIGCSSGDEVLGKAFRS